MKTAIALTLSSMVLAACASTGHDPASGQAMSSPAADAIHNYRCESGEQISASYPDTDSAIVEYRGTRYDMTVAVSGSGARYVGGGLEWWTKGSGAGAAGTLFRHQPDGTSGDMVESCEEY